MKIYKCVDMPLCKEKEKYAVCLGLFDGVHKGHRELIQKTVDMARSLGVKSAVFTFTSENTLPKSAKRIYATADKLEIFRELCIDAVFIAEFSLFKNMSAEDFIDKFIKDGISAAAVLTGEDFRFGKGAAGSTEMLEGRLLSHGIEYIKVDDLKDGEGEKISSAKIKALLKNGELEAANRLLESPYFLKGMVVRGDGRGKRLGYPTINTEISENRDVLKYGVYKTSVEIGEKSYTGITNVGICPTFGERSVHAETYIIDEKNDLYGKEVKISFLEYLREEIRFSSAEELKMQINVDIMRVKGEK